MSLQYYVFADGTKLPPMLVFKGQPEGRVEKKRKIILYYKVRKYLLIVKEKLGIMKQ